MIELSSDTQHQFNLDVLKITEVQANLQCADCNSINPDWISLGFATVICIDCAGKHRSFGTHITSVRSLTLDNLQTEQTNCILLHGNQKFRNYLRTLDSETSSISDDKSSTPDYEDPKVQFYRELIQAESELRDPMSFSEFLSAVDRQVSIDETNGEQLQNVWIVPTKRVNTQPTQAPTWVPDKATKKCMICSRKFGFVTRKHHCRRCGKCICERCAPANNTRPILEWSISEAVRHCRLCYQSPSVTWT